MAVPALLVKKGAILIKVHVQLVEIIAQSVLVLLTAMYVMEVIFGTPQFAIHAM